VAAFCPNTVADGQAVYYTVAVTIKSLKVERKYAMDFMNRSEQAQPAHQQAPVSSASSSAPVSRGDKGAHRKETSKWSRVGAVAMLFALTILIVAAIGVLFYGPSDQSKFVDKSKYQAVFLTNGQVYFGKLTNVSKDFFKLNNIYYLTQNSSTDSKGTTTTDGNYTLVKLGCQQIHDPYDQMVIETNQVSFWENLQDSGKVVTSINQFVKQNPKGPDCTQVSNQTQATSNSATQGTGTNSTTNSTTKNP